jgi:hypothetical protein
MHGVHLRCMRCGIPRWRYGTGPSVATTVGSRKRSAGTATEFTRLTLIPDWQVSCPQLPL